jgi:23S rRNA (pseudouridine1915-N3)-methyltransferase
MKVKLLCIGKTSERYLRDGIEVYTKRLGHYCNFELQVIKDVKVVKDRARLLADEGKAFLSQISMDDTVVLLDELGKPYTSESFAGYLERHMVQRTRRLVFVIGGAYGFDEAMRARANSTLTMSTMTLSHQMIRLFFVEQLYRGFTIIRNEKYHNP